MAAQKKTPSKKTAPSASSPTGSGKKTAAKKAGSAAAAKKAAKKATASRASTATATKKTATKKTAAKKTAAGKGTTRKTAAKKTAAKKAAASPKKAAGGTRRAAAGTSSPKKSAPAAKKSTASAEGKASLREREEMIRKRTRKETAGTSTPTNAPVFTLADVRDYLRQQKASAEAAATPAKKAKAAKGATKKTARKAAETTATPEPPAPRKSQSFGAASVADLLGFDPTQKEETALKDRDEKDVPKKFLPYFRALLRLHEEVLEGLHRHSEETLRRSSKEDSGDLSSYGQHMADAGTESYERDFALSLVSSEQEALYEIDEALRRIHEGTYGICEITGKPISRERLRAVPFTRYSVEGQREVEKRQTRQVQRAGIQSSLDGEESPVLGDDDSGEE